MSPWADEEVSISEGHMCLGLPSGRMWSNKAHTTEETVSAGSLLDLERN